MGSGKSRVGKQLSENLGYELIDTDECIEQAEGMNIQEIFRKKGEWYFRQLESNLLKELAHKTKVVIVTGGGTPISSTNAMLLRELGEIFFLDAALPFIIERLKKSKRRPLGKANTEEERQELTKLYLHRRPVYANIGHRIDVNHQDKARTRQDIIERFLAKKSLGPIATTDIYELVGSYPIYHQRDILPKIKNMVIALGLKDFAPVIITSDRLKHVLAATVQQIKQSFGQELPVLSIRDGEQYKNLESIDRLHQDMFDHGLTRKTLVIALGGGNVGDVAGFASSIYLRGVPTIQVPTTLLAMVDASIGGKTGVDTSFGKNLIGSFYQPKAVIIDSNILDTLPQDEFACGMAEIVKHAIIADRELFFCLKEEKPHINLVIERALRVKADIVFNDPQENHIRAYLNLGHTYAHAIEKVSQYTIKHGQAVAMGLVMAVKLAKRLGMLEEDFTKDLECVLLKHNLPVTIPQELKTEALLAAMKHDKKRDPHGLKMVVPKRIGEVCLAYVEEKDIF